MSIISDKLKSFDYYKNKLPLYLQNDDCFVAQFKDIWHSIMTNAIDVSDEMLALLNIFDPNYFEEHDNASDMLEKIAALFNVYRQTKVDYIDENLQHVSKFITLTDEELLLLIKAQIIRSYFDGSREQIVYLYDKILKLAVFYVTNNTVSCECDVYLIIVEDSDYEYSENIKEMFLSGLLNLESMGITYTYLMTDLQNLLVWDKPIEVGIYTGWDGGIWSI